MREREELCVGCAECIGCHLRNQYALICYCDVCGDTIDDIYYMDGDDELCESCAAESLFNKTVDPEKRKDIIENMEEEGYSINVMDDVIECLNIPPKNQMDVFSLTYCDEDYY